MRGETSNLRAELRAAAQEARRTATPVGGFEQWGDWKGVDPKAIRELEHAMQDLRREAVSAWKRHGITAEQSREVVAILREATGRVREVFTSAR